MVFSTVKRLTPIEKGKQSKKQNPASTLPHAMHAASDKQSKPSAQARQAIKQWAKLRPSDRHQKAKKKPSTRPGQFFRFCLISSAINNSFARSINAKSLLIVKPVNRIKGFIEEIALGLKP
jgi:hypothetical protein